jgi:tetratricopeptide (TPR) repeat protein
VVSRRPSGAVDGPFISAALIVRDEEHHLTDCLRSIAGIVDEIVVVDTGSIDRTRELALAEGAQVLNEPWRDDFAHARNVALDHCRGSWILYIDADERVRDVSAATLRAELDQHGLVGAEVMFHATTRLTAYPELRLFRNDPRIRFKGIIHETIWPEVLDVIAEDGGGIGRSSVVIDHIGYEGSQDHKYERDLPLLQKALSTNPDHVFCWFHLGLTQMGLHNRTEARDAWRSGMQAASRREVRRPADALPYIALAQDLLDSGEDADDPLNQGLALFPSDPLLRWHSARALMALEEWDEALAQLVLLQRADSQGELPNGIGFPTLQFTSRTSVLIGDCQHQMGRYGEAAETYRQAREAEPTNLEYRVKQELNEHLATAGR